MLGAVCQRIPMQASARSELSAAGLAACVVFGLHRAAMLARIKNPAGCVSQQQFLG
jgi:hypothetical protein